MLLAVFLVVLSAFLFNGIVKKSKDLASGRNSAALLEQESNDIENFKKNYSDYKSNLERIDQLFIDSHNPVNFIKFLEETSASYGLDMNVAVPSFSQGSSVQGNFQISLSGDFYKIAEFIQAIENGPYLVQVKNLNIAKSQGPDKKQLVGQIAASISIQVLAK